MNIVIAPNSFKESLDAFSAAQSIAAGLAKSKLQCKCKLFPIADGGDYTLEVFHNWHQGQPEETEVLGPLGRPVGAKWLYLPEHYTAVIEMAKASGISLLQKNELNPMKASTYGTGQLIRTAIEKGAKKIILGLGGSATVDGGLGILQALGCELLDKAGGTIARDTNPLLSVKDIFVEKMPEQFGNIECVLLCDVDNPLLGENGAVHVFGPQKGAKADDLEKLENGMKRLNGLIKEKTGKDYSTEPGTGAAGGIALVLMAFFNTSIHSGVEYLLAQTDFEASLPEADLLITAEGKADRQTLGGKGPSAVAKRAAKYGVPSVLLVGKADHIEELNNGFSAVFPITNGPVSLEKAMQHTAKDLERTALQIGNLLQSIKLKSNDQYFH